MKPFLLSPTSSSLRLLQHVIRPLPPLLQQGAIHPVLRPSRPFHSSPFYHAIRTQKLTDVGEGIKEVEIIQWFVEEGGHVEEWAPICEAQTDKSTVELSARYTGVVRKLYAKAEENVQTGQPLVDIDVIGEEEEAAETAEEQADDAPTTPETDKEEERPQNESPVDDTVQGPQENGQQEHTGSASLATPAVRGLLKEHGIAIENVPGTGSDGRVTKEDVDRYFSSKSSSPTPQPTSISKPSIDAPQTETPQRLTHIQQQMFRTMTASLHIPHFLYTDTLNMTHLSHLRKSLNSSRDNSTAKLSFLPFIVKAVSLALNQYPLLNARIEASSDSQKPQIVMRSNHNVGIAMDTPSGLIVPVVKNVNARSIHSIAAEISRLSALGQKGKLTPNDLSGGTITVSNIGNIGGGVLAPVIVEGRLAILGVGKIKAVPVFGEDGNTVERAEMAAFSWSADHRVVDGATMARMAEVVRLFIEEPGRMLVELS